MSYFALLTILLFTNFLEYQGCSEIDLERLKDSKLPEDEYGCCWKRHELYGLEWWDHYCDCHWETEKILGLMPRIVYKILRRKRCVCKEVGDGDCIFPEIEYSSESDDGMDEFRLDRGLSFEDQDPAITTQSPHSDNSHPDEGEEECNLSPHSCSDPDIRNEYSELETIETDSPLAPL